MKFITQKLNTQILHCAVESGNSELVKYILGFDRININLIPI